MTTNQPPEDFSSLQPLFDATSQKINAIIEEDIRINRILLQGFLKIQRLLYRGGNVSKTEINDIILDTLNQIAPRK